MKKLAIILILITAVNSAIAQCAICTKTAQQMGERPAKALNTGIVYLALVPLAIFGIIGYRWWKSNQE
jgi:F0F1-type ATP synthase membrane subunit c/vacuolar-type H+-ATPase subunit K